MPAQSPRIAVGVSGGGRSLRNLLRAEAAGAGFTVAAVIASRPDCKAVEIAAEHGLPTFVEIFSAQRSSDVAKRLYPWLAKLDIGWIALAGFLKLFPLDPAWQGRIVNIHPALLPKFGGPGMYGDRVHAAVLASGEKESGASVHFVSDRYDEGALIAQIVVPVNPKDDEHSLAARVFDAECVLYPRTIERLVSGDWAKSGARVERLRHG